jgi:hypothetical protein
MKPEYSQQNFEKRTDLSSFIKIRLVGVELLRAHEKTDGQRNMTKLVVAFPNFKKAPKNDSILTSVYVSAALNY